MSSCKRLARLSPEVASVANASARARRALVFWSCLNGGKATATAFDSGASGMGKSCTDFFVTKASLVVGKLAIITPKLKLSIVMEIGLSM